MSQTQTPPSNVTQELITALASLGIGGGSNPKLDSILDRLDRKSAKEEAKELEDIELAKRGREANIRDVKLRHENERLKRASCSHRNEHNRTNVRGQRDHDQNTIWLCQTCQNMWKDFARAEDAARPENARYKPLPRDLYPNTEIIWVGGPVAS